MVDTLPHCLRIDYSDFCGLCDESQVAHGQLRIGRVYVKGVDLLDWWLVGDDSDVGVYALQEGDGGPLELHAQAHFIYALFYSKNYYFSPTLAQQTHPPLSSCPNPAKKGPSACAWVGQFMWEEVNLSLGWI